MAEEAVTPAGNPTTEKLTWLLNEPPCVLVTLTCALLPGANASVGCDAERDNVPGDVTVSGRDTVSLKPLPLAVGNKVYLPSGHRWRC